MSNHNIELLYNKNMVDPAEVPQDSNREFSQQTPESSELAPLRLDEAHAGTLGLDDLEAQLHSLRNNNRLPAGQRLTEEQLNEELHFVYEAVQQEGRRQFEALTEQQLREQVVTGINGVLGRLAVGPVADGTGAMGYGREWNWQNKSERGELEKGAMLPLFCSYIRFTKAFNRDEQIGVRLELLGIMDSGRMYFALKSRHDEEAKRIVEMTPEERAKHQRFSEEIESLQPLRDAIDADGLAPADNRYYYFPLNEIEPVMVSTESFISRAHSLNPEAAERAISPEVISKELEKQEAPIDPESGKPRWRTANLQDLRDAAAIVGGYTGFVADIIQQTPKEVWGRPGMTE